MEQVCGNCREMLVGAYCHGCGQKRLGDGDRRLAHLFGQFLAAATDVDGRFWRSVRALMLQPGRLSREYLDGRRRWWLAPMTLFLLANVLYFLAPQTMTDFNLSLVDQMRQVHSPLTQPWILARVAEREREVAGYTLQDYGRAYDAQAGNVGKALLIAHVPFIGGALWLMFRRRRLYFAEHLVVATHMFTFTLLFVQLVLLPLGWLIEGLGLDGPLVAAIGIAALASLFAYHALAVRRVYATRWRVSVLAPVPLLAALMAGNIFVYRFVQFALTFALT